MCLLHVTSQCCPPSTSKSKQDRHGHRRTEAGEPRGMGRTDAGGVGSRQGRAEALSESAGPGRISGVTIRSEVSFQNSFVQCHHRKHEGFRLFNEM